VGCVPDVQAEVATWPGVMMMLHVPEGAKVIPVQLSVVILVPVGKPAGVTVNGVVVSVVLVLVMVISLKFPVSAAFE